MAFFKFRQNGESHTPPSRPSESVEVMRRRAKHRLIGAAVLVAIGVIGFPILFDTQPRPIPVDVQIEIPDRNKVAPLALPVASEPAAPALAAAKPTSGPGAAGGVGAPPSRTEPAEPKGPPVTRQVAPAPSESRIAAGASLDATEQLVVPEPVKNSAKDPVKAPASKAVSAPVSEAKPEARAASRPAPKAEGKLEPKPEPKPEPKSEPKAEPKADHKADHKPEPKAEAKSDPKPEPKPEPKTDAHAGSDNRSDNRSDDGARAKSLLEGKDPGKPAAGADAARFIVQVGAFADAAKARDIRQKLERAGLKTYTHVAETKEGQRIRVRLGPFATKAEADKAAAKVKHLALPAAILSL